MDGIFALAAENLISPIILFFALGFAAAFARSELSVPEAIAKGMSLYLLIAIGFKGGASVADHGVDATLILSLLAGIILSFALPFVAFGLLRVLTQLPLVDAAAVAAHYGSISIVTFVSASSVLTSAGIAAEGYMVAVAAAMEAPAILSALWLVACAGGGAARRRRVVAWAQAYCAKSYSMALSCSCSVPLRSAQSLGNQASRRSRPLSSRRSKACSACFCWIWVWLLGEGFARHAACCVQDCSSSASSCR